MLQKGIHSDTPAIKFSVVGHYLYYIIKLTLEKVAGKLGV